MTQPSQDWCDSEPLRQAGAKRGQLYFVRTFVLAALESRGTLTDLKSAGATTANVTQAIEQMRGGESVNDQGAEDQRQAFGNLRSI
jgi:ATP-dependent Clp protease ATP-binding subunit ClpB